MIGKGNLQEPVYITAQEAVALSKYTCCVDTLYRAAEVMEEWNDILKPSMFSWDTMNLLATIYQRGRIQGIREQRAKAKAKNARPAVTG